MQNPQEPNSDGKNPRRKDKLLAIDSYINNSLYTIKSWLSQLWGIALIVFDRYRIYGFKKFFIDVSSELLNLGTLGITIFSLIGSATLFITNSDWHNKDNLSVTFLDRYNNVIGQRGSMSAQSVPLNEMPPYVIKAVLATEDRRFFSHRGLDFWGLGRALTQNVEKGGVVQGGSTLTQQLAKNMFLSNERTLARKVKEAFLAIWLEANYSKKQILQMYLDNAYMGGGNFGIAAASKFYFNKDIRKVTLAEAAMLAGLFKAPSKFAPHIHPLAAQERANVVLNNLVESGFMNESEVAEARRHPAVTSATESQQSPDYFLDYAYEEVKKLNIKFPTQHIIVQTTLDSKIQTIAQQTVKRYLQYYGNGYHVSQAAVVVLANNGSLRAMVGGKDYDESHFNRATHGERQVGSSFKPYVYALALNQGLTPDSIVLDEPINWGGWEPHNDNNRYLGRVNLTTALAYSLNTVAVRLAHDVLHGDTTAIYNFVKSMGIEGNILKHKTMVLGTSNMTALDQATGYNVFANGGMAGNRHIFLRINTSDGKLIWSYSPQKMYRVLSAQSTAYLNQMMTQVVEKGSGRRAVIAGINVAGKTGTTQSFRDAWFVGYTGNFTTAVWMGNDNYRPTNRLFGGILPAMIFRSIMQEAQKTVMPAQLYGVSAPSMRPNNLQSNASYSDLGILSPTSTNVIRNIAKELAND